MSNPKKGDIKTMAGDLAEVKKTNPTGGLPDSPTNFSFNEKLRKGFGIVSETTNQPHSATPPRPDLEKKPVAQSGATPISGDKVGEKIADAPPFKTDATPLQPEEKGQKKQSFEEIFALAQKQQRKAGNAETEKIQTTTDIDASAGMIRVKDSQAKNLQKEISEKLEKEAEQKKIAANLERQEQERKNKEEAEKAAAALKIQQAEKEKAEAEQKKIAADLERQEQERKNKEEAEKAAAALKIQQAEREKAEAEQKKMAADLERQEQERKNKEEAEKAAAALKTQQTETNRKKEIDKIERQKAVEEKRRRLALLEAEKEKKKKEDSLRQEEISATTKKETIKETPGLSSELPEVLQNLIQKLDNKKDSFEKKIVVILDSKTPLENKKKELSTKIAQIKNNELKIVEKREEEIEKKEEEEKSQIGNKLEPSEEKIYNQKLWAIEEQRKEIEKQRWEVEDKIEKIELEIKKAELEISQREGEAAAVKRQSKNIASQEKLVDFVIEKNKIEEEILISAKEKDEIMPLLAKAVGIETAATKKLQELIEKEKSAAAELEEIENKEKQATEPSAKRIIEQTRWRISSNLKAATQSKWEVQDNLKQAEINKQNLQSQANAVQARINKLQNAIASSEIVLENEGMSVHNLRDTVAELIKENGLFIDSECLKEIIQPDDLRVETPKIITPEPIAQKVPERVVKEEPSPQINPPLQKNSSATDNDEIKTAKIFDIPKPTSDDTQKNSAPEISDIKNKISPVENKAAAPASIPINLPIVGEEKVKFKTEDKVKIEKKDGSPAGIKNNPEKNPEINTEIKPPANNPIDTTIQPAKINNGITSEERLPKDQPLVKQESKTLTSSAAASNSFRETIEPTTISSKTSTASTITAKPSPSLRSSIPAYRESIEKPDSPTNIPIFRERDSVGRQDPIQSTSATKQNPQSTTLSAEETSKLKKIDAFAADSLGDRWSQIKKTNSPVPNPEIIAAIAKPQSAAEIAPSKSDGGKNFIVRILIILLVVGIIGVAIVLAFNKKPSPPTVKTPTPTNNDEAKKQNPSSPETDPKETKQTPILATLSPIPIYADSLTSIPNLLYPHLNGSIGPDGYYHVIIQNKKDNTFVGLKQFFDIFGINAPAGFYSSVSDDFILYIYSNGGKNRLGFVTRITDAAALETTMSGWKANLVQDTDFLFKSLGKKTQPANTTLTFVSKKSADGSPYQSLAFQPSDANLSLNYALYNGKYFIFSTSSDSMAKIFDQLSK